MPLQYTRSGAMGARILIADADASNAAALEQRVRQIGFEPVGMIVQHGLLLDRVAIAAPDVVLMDLHFGGDMEGLRLAIRIQREMQRPVVCFTSSPPCTRHIDPTSFVGILFRPENDGCLRFAIESQMYRFEIERRLQEVEERFRLLGDTIHEVFWIITPTLSRVEYVSPGVEKLFGITQAELYADPRTWFALIDPADIEEIRARVRHGFRNGTDSYALRHRIIRPDGARRWVLTTAYPARDCSGAVQKVVGISEDITERRTAEESLSRAQFSIDHASDALFWIDQQGRIVYANEAACSSLGYARGELVGMNIHAVDQRMNTDAWNRHWIDLRAAGTLRHESEHRTKEGVRFPVEFTSNFVEFEGEQFNFAFVRNVASRKLAERNLQESRNQALRFSSLAAHEIRNPLTIIRTQLESSLRPGMTAEALQKVISSVYDDMLRLNNVVEDLLHLSAMQTGTFRMKLERIAIGSFLQEFFREAVLLAKSKEIRIELQRGDEAFALVDVMRLRQVFFNLLDNALKHSEPRSCVRIGHAIDDRHVYIRFTDEGHGIPAREIKEIFAPFYRGSSAPESVGGVGLGLALVKWIVDLHNGSIDVESTEGVGTTFAIRLPIADETGRPRIGIIAESSRNGA